MKLKKFFAGVLAAAMMLTVGATAAFATEPSNKTISVKDNDGNAKMFQTGDATLTLTKSLEVENGTAPNEMEFTFSVADSGNTAVAGATTAAKFEAGQNKKIKAFVAGKTYTANFTVDIEKLLGDTKKNTVGEYTYTISENDTQIPGITKDDNELTLKVTVVNATGEIGGGYGYYAALYRGGKKIEATDAFHNTYNANSLTLSKTVHGALGNLSKDFTFKIKFTKADALQNNTDTGLYKGPQVAELSSTATIKDGTTDIAKSAYLELDKEYTVTLRHNDSLNLSNLPAGIKYEIYEDGSQVEAGAVVVTVDNVKYTVTVTDTAFDTTETTKIKGTVNNTDVTAAFQNTNPDSPDMGVILDNAPYIALLAIVAIGGVALMLNKRRRDEE